MAHSAVLSILTLSLGALTVMKARDPGFWYQPRMNMTNVNMLTSLSLADLVSLTSTSVCDVDQVGREVGERLKSEKVNGKVGESM